MKSSRMSLIISAMTEENYGISARKPKNRTAIPRPLKCMDVQTVAAVSIRPDVCTNIMHRQTHWKGILNRQIRSIQTEGHLGISRKTKNSDVFHYRSAEKVYKEFMLYAIGRNINKYHRFLYEELQKYEGKKEEKTA